jgi:flagellar biosynthetic protein FliR
MTTFEAFGRVLTALGVGVPVDTFVFIVGLVVARLATAISLTPFLGGAAVPAQARIGLAFLMALFIAPAASHRWMLPAMNPLFALGLLLKEGTIGAIIGLVTRMVFDSIQMAGDMIDLERGMSQMTFLSPQLQGNTSAIGQLQFQAALAFFLAIGGHLFFMRALAMSFVTLPLFGFPALSAGPMAVADLVIRISAGSLLVAVQLAAPAMIAMFMVDAGFAAVGRVVQQFPIYRESFPLKALLGLLVVMLTAALTFDAIGRWLAKFLSAIPELLNAMT